LWCIEGFDILLWFLRFFEKFKSIFEFSNIESLIAVEVADLEGFGKCLFFLEDAVETSAAISLT
jgi:hypothetical protein